MRKKRFLAIAAAIAVSMTFPAPAAVFATEADESADIVDDEQEEGEQTTVAEPDAESGGDNSGSSSGTSGAGGSGTSSGGSNGTGSTSGQKSPDSSLAVLDIAPGDLSPAFSPGTYSYTSTVDADVTRLSVAAKPNNSKAVIASVSGAKSIKPGTNTVKVVVEAENGAVSTYTITVTCGSAASAPDTPSQASDTSSQGADAPPQAADTQERDGESHTPEGEISVLGENDEEPEEESEVTFDSNGYLIYEGKAYIPSESMPEGEYVALSKYNKLYEQAQAQKNKSMRLVIIFVIVTVLLLIVILNLALKLRDVRQDMKLGIGGPDDKEAPAKRRAAKAPDTTMIPDVKRPEQARPDKKRQERPAAARADRGTKAPERTAAAGKTKAPERTVAAGKTKATAKTPAAGKARTPAKAQEKKKTAQTYEDLEILDLNDL